MKLKKKKEEKKTLRANSKMPKHFIAIATLKCYVLYIYVNLGLPPQGLKE
jgi:hypothetical protein